MSLEDFMVSTVASAWGTEVEKEVRNRIKLSVAAYAYEVHSDSIMSDGEFDHLALQINQNLPTGNSIIDKFFVEQFSPYTGQWIHNHPDKPGLEKLYQKYYIKPRKKRK
jgi:hypothetical protein